MQGRRFDFLADQKPRVLKEYVLDQVADELAKDLRAFPPPALEWSDEAARARWLPVLERTTRPELDTFRVACELARLQLLHEVDAIDKFLRSPEASALLPAPLEERTALFIAEYLVESALSFQEFAKGKFRRRELVTLIEKVEDRMLRGYRLRLTAANPLIR